MPLNKEPNQTKPIHILVEKFTYSKLMENIPNIRCLVSGALGYSVIFYEGVHCSKKNKWVSWIWYWIASDNEALVLEIWGSVYCHSDLWVVLAAFICLLILVLCSDLLFIFFKNNNYLLFAYKWYMYIIKQDLALNNQQGLICY